MTDESLDSALVAVDIAIQTEKDGHEFYLGAAAKSSDPQGKALFASLAEDELEHLRLLQAQRDALTGERRWLPHSAPAAEAPHTRVLGVPIFSHEALAREINAYTSELSALRMAFLIEKDAVAFYSKAALETDDPDGKALYEYLVGMEKDHQRILEQEYNALAQEFRTSMGFEPF
jgi:rubrerythrin